MQHLAAARAAALAPRTSPHRTACAAHARPPVPLPLRTLPGAPVASRRRASFAAPQPRRRSRRLAAAANAAAATPPLPPLSPEQATLKGVLGSACAAAVLVVLGSLLTARGRARWAALFASWAAALPANPSLRRALAWLPLIAVSKALESAFGLPLLNWVYIAFGASTLLSAIQGAATAQTPVVPWAPAAPGGAAPAAQPAAPPLAPAPASEGGAGVGGINAIARNLFASRFPALAAEAVLVTSPAMLASAAGQAQGQLYLTSHHVAFHGTFGRGSRTVALAEVTLAEAAAPPPGDAKAAQLAVLRLDAPGGELRLSAVAALGGADAIALVLQAWQQQATQQPSGEGA